MVIWEALYALLRNLGLHAVSVMGYERLKEMNRFVSHFRSGAGMLTARMVQMYNAKD